MHQLARMHLYGLTKPWSIKALLGLLVASQDYSTLVCPHLPHLNMPTTGAFAAAVACEQVL